MAKREQGGILAKAVCVGARSGIIVALYLTAFLSALGLAAVLPEFWSAVGITALLLVVGLRLSQKWPRRAFRLESVELGYQPDRQPNPQLAAARGVPAPIPASFRRALGLLLNPLL